MIHHTYLLLEAQSLFKRIVQLRVRVAELLAAHESLEALAEAWARAMPFGEGGHYLWMPDLICNGEIEPTPRHGS